MVEPLHMPALGGATEWLDSEPLGPAELRGHVVLVDFWTLTTPTASSVTTTSAKDATSNPSAPSSGCSVERELVCVEGLGVLIGVLGFRP